MKRFVFLYFLLVYTSNCFSQSCEILQGVKKTESYYYNGNFKESLLINQALLECENLTSKDAIILLKWNYKINRNISNNIIAQAAILKAKRLTKKHPILLDIELKLLLSESYALTNDVLHSEEILKQLKKELFNSSSTNNKIHYYLINYHNLIGQGLTNKSLQSLQKALLLYNESPLIAVYYSSNIFKGLGRIYRTNGDFDKSLFYYKKELQILENVFPPSHLTVSICKYHIGNVYYEKLEYQNALDYYLETHLVWKKNYAADFQYMRYLNEAIGDMYWELNDYKNALYYFNLAALNEDKVNNDSSEISIFQGDSLSKKGNYNKAIIYYENALLFREKTFGKNHVLTGACKNYVARAKRFSGDTEGALHDYQEVISILVEEMNDTSWYENPSLEMTVQSPKFLLETLIAKGELLNELFQKTNNINDLIASLQTFEIAISILEKMKNNEMSESSKSFWTKHTLSLFENSIHTAYQLHQITNDIDFIKKAFEFSERSKALLLLASLSGQQKISFANVPEAIINKEQELKFQINEYQGKIESEEKRCEAIREKILGLWKNKLSSLQNELDILISEIRIKHPEYYNLKYHPKIANLSSIQKTIINKKTALVSYFFGEELVFIFSITQNKLTIRKIGNVNVLSNQITSFFNSINNNKTNQLTPQLAFESFKKESHQLYRTLIEPELTNLETNKLIIIPDGIISYLPFDCLLTFDSSSKKRDYKSLPYLIKKQAISYSPSASIRIIMQNNKDVKSEYLGFAPNYNGIIFTDNSEALTSLFFNTKEVDFATQLFKGESWKENEVTEELLKKKCEQAGILHLAMHGDVDNENPLLSKLYAIPSKTEDGMLHAFEIYNLKIPSQIVILSACNTASGKLERGEGVLSLERAFQYAGCKSLLSTLWPIDDESSFLINQYFLENLNNGLEKDIALQNAKLKFILNTTPDKLHPFFWSSFKLSGNTDTLLKTANSIYYFFGAGAFVIVIILYLKRKKHKKVA